MSVKRTSGHIRALARNSQQTGESIAAAKVIAREVEEDPKVRAQLRVMLESLRDLGVPSTAVGTDVQFIDLKSETLGPQRIGPFTTAFNNLTRISTNYAFDGEILVREYWPPWQPQTYRFACRQHSIPLTLFKDLCADYDVQLPEQWLEARTEAAKTSGYYGPRV